MNNIYHLNPQNEDNERYDLRSFHAGKTEGLRQNMVEWYNAGLGDASDGKFALGVAWGAAMTLAFSLTAWLIAGIVGV